jgi:small GTP-binding protein
MPQSDADYDTTTRYTTAKLILVGDSGVGKTGLGWRLAHNEFKEQSSTHGQQFWPIPDLGLTLEDGTQCEAVLWDLAGQPIYGQVHALFLDNIDTALILFDPTTRLEPLKGVTTWIENLKGKDKLPPSILVGARTDRGQPTLSREELDKFCQEKGITGGYISTSAVDGSGIDELFERLSVLIPWEEMVTTVTTRTFKRIKDYILALKEKPNGHSVLVNATRLRQQLQASDPFWEFSEAELITAVSHLENHGYVTILKSVSGEAHILLAPDLLPNLVASIVLKADNDPNELGSVSESELLQGSHAFAELQGLDQDEQRILLDAAVLRLIENNICFRENVEGNILLIFPALIKQKRPLHDTTPTTDDITYVVRGQIENLYASLVVRLSYSPSFTCINQWQNEAQFQSQDGHICGFRFKQEQEGEIKLVLNYSSGIPEAKKLEFESLFQQLIDKSEVTVTPYPPIYCPNGHIQERETVEKRQQSGKDHLFCNECGERVKLLEIAESSSIGLSAAPWLQYQEAQVQLRSTYEAQLGRIKSYHSGYPAPNCYISYLPQQEQFASRLRRDLNKASLFVIEDPDQVRPEDVILILSTPDYHQASMQQSELLRDDIPLVQGRNNLDKTVKNLIALDLEDNPLPPHDLKSCQPGNFTIDTHYEVSLFDLILDLYRIPFDSEACAPLRQALHQQWQETLMGQKISDREIDVSVLLDLLNARLGMEEVKMITFGMIDDFDNIPGNTKISKIRGAIQYFQHREQLEMFLNKLGRHRPDINLSNIYK